MDSLGIHAHTRIMNLFLFRPKVAAALHWRIRSDRIFDLLLVVEIERRLVHRTSERVGVCFLFFQQKTDDILRLEQIEIEIGWQSSVWYRCVNDTLFTIWFDVCRRAAEAIHTVFECFRNENGKTNRSNHFRNSEDSSGWASNPGWNAGEQKTM